MKITKQNNVSFGAIYKVQGYEKAVSIARNASNTIIRAHQINKQQPKNLYVVATGRDAIIGSAIKNLYKSGESSNAALLLKNLLDKVANKSIY